MPQLSQNLKLVAIPISYHFWKKTKKLVQGAAVIATRQKKKKVKAKKETHAGNSYHKNLPKITS